MLLNEKGSIESCLAQSLLIAKSKLQSEIETNSSKRHIEKSIQECCR